MSVTAYVGHHGIYPLRTAIFVKDVLRFCRFSKHWNWTAIPNTLSSHPSQLGTFITVSRHFSLTSKCDAGHSHWKNIQHIKGANDALRAQKMNRLVSQMRIVAKTHGSFDPKQNTALAKLIEAAKADNLSTERIKSVLAKMAASKDTRATLEMKGPGGALMIVELITDNAVKTKQELRSTTKKFPIQFVDGAAASGIRFNFEEKGIVTAVMKNGNADMGKAEEDAIEIGAEDVEEGSSANEIVFLCEPMELNNVTKGVEQKGYTVLDSAVEFLPKQIIQLDENASDILNKFLDIVEQRDDFSKIYRNW
ncbi:probable transcriptional regulatory protein Pmob_0807 [Paramacrobiotus metropolitanus]|uniref:probable transcriptional regulatory protein Pmob_0807 n=1 Tax=Paramacrobiotus metropolitanus TaxID=2943436 RepID=UPI0024456A04|nr:probable transcriptional regulatory protein Pmob_0807 [Paramacrobiotus metropolitanus]